MKHILRLLSSLLFILFVSCNQFQSQDTEQEITESRKIPNVTIKKLTLTDEPLPIPAVGTVAQKEIQNLSFKTGGVIEKITVNTSQTVRKGQLLAELRTNEATAQLEKAQTVFEKASRDLEKLAKMYADTAATLTQLESLQTKVDLAKSDLELAEINVNNAKLIAPANGKILRKMVRQNEVVAPGVPVLQFASKGKKSLVIKTTATDKDLVLLKLGDKAKVYFDVYPEQTFGAYITQIAEAAHPLTGTFEIELSFASIPKETIKTGFVCSIELLPANQSPYFKIDLNALVEGSENAANIFLLKEAAQKTFVQKITVLPDQIQKGFFSTSDPGLKEGLSVVTTGAAWLSDGMEVNVIYQD
ncbi:MAG: efflux RND transporter periplasmic adaptor subunit [Bacteroidota bacterium]